MVPKEWGVNACGSSSPSVHSASAPPAVTLTTRRCGANSTSTWRQMPHGGVGVSASVAITMLVKSRTPRDTATLTAARSAQMPAGNDAFSMLHPSVTLRGAGRQRKRLPCFHFGARVGLLPAFGDFTGTADVAVLPGDRVYVVAGGDVLEIGGS